MEELKTRAALADKLHGAFNFDAINESFFVAVGTAEQVVDQLERMGRADGHQPFQHSRRDRQHAALEGGEEPAA